ncbi:hypothetical protein JKP88DRAFT_336780 [Tribonema minus]|uniref:Uncharacterized protein n=1 Tax=Tribonema minus TaxID=303371 RepID=A0A836C8Q5_9STRA|nr:hypothetical protein JKP88DRAFT_336780 [Tribonema minus]
MHEIRPCTPEPEPVHVEHIPDPTLCFLEADLDEGLVVTANGYRIKTLGGGKEHRHDGAPRVILGLAPLISSEVRTQTMERTAGSVALTDSATVLHNGAELPNFNSIDLQHRQFEKGDAVSFGFDRAEGTVEIGKNGVLLGRVTLSDGLLPDLHPAVTICSARADELLDAKAAALSSKPLPNPSATFNRLCKTVEGVVVEGPHPYPSSMKHTAFVTVPEAACVALVFDGVCNATAGDARVTIWLDEWRTQRLGPPDGYKCLAGDSHRTAPFHGTVLEQSTGLPGMGNIPPLFVPQASFLVTFHADRWVGQATDGADWGWRVVAYHCDSEQHGLALWQQAREHCHRAAALNAPAPPPRHGETALHVAARAGNHAAVTCLCSSGGADLVNARWQSGGGGGTALHEAAGVGACACAAALIAAGADVAVADDCGETALHVAARYGYASLTKLLLQATSDHGATLLALRNTKGKTALQLVPPGCHPLIALLTPAVKGKKEAHYRSPIRGSRLKVPGSRGSVGVGRAPVSQSNLSA